MIQKKICMLGGFGVGKTSLVSRFVHSIFSDNSPAVCRNGVEQAVDTHFLRLRELNPQRQLVPTVQDLNGMSLCS